MSNQPPAVIDADRHVVRRTVVICAPIEKVWAAVTEPEHISRWFGEAKVEGFRVGATGTLSWPDHDPIPLRIEAIETPSRVSYRWSNDGASSTPAGTHDDVGSTVFTFTLEPTAEGTRLTVEESGFEMTSDAQSNLHSHRDGWDHELDELVALLERPA